MLWPGVRLSATTRRFIETVVVVVVVVVTFFNNNFANCKATLILEIKNLRNKIQYKPKLIELISGTEANVCLPHTVLWRNTSDSKSEDIPSNTLSQTRNLADRSAFCHRNVDRRRCC